VAIDGLLAGTPPLIGTTLDQGFGGGQHGRPFAGPFLGSAAESARPDNRVESAQGGELWRQPDHEGPPRTPRRGLLHHPDSRTQRDAKLLILDDV